MICFEVIINGEKICTTGTGEEGVITAIFSYVKQAAEENTSDESDEPRLHVGGYKNGVHLEWTDGILEIGDEVTIRVIETNEFDAPVREYRDDPEQLERQKREFYEQCKREFEGA